MSYCSTILVTIKLPMANVKHTFNEGKISYYSYCFTDKETNLKRLEGSPEPVNSGKR